MKKVMFNFNTEGKDVREEIIEFNDDVTDDEIEIKFTEWINDIINVSWQKIMPIKGTWVINEGYVGDCPKCNYYIFEEFSKKRCKYCRQPIVWEYDENDEHDLTVDEFMKLKMDIKKPAL